MFLLFRFDNNALNQYLFENLSTYLQYHISFTKFIHLILNQSIYAFFKVTICNNLSSTLINPHSVLLSFSLFNSYFSPFSSSLLPRLNLWTMFSLTHGAVPTARLIRSGTMNRATLMKAKASAPSFCVSSGFEKSGQWPKA